MAGCEDRVEKDEGRARGKRGGGTHSSLGISVRRSL